MPPDPPRGAKIEIYQQGNGYWHGYVKVRIPFMPDQEFESGMFHDAIEALDWARLMVHTAVGNAL